MIRKRVPKLLTILATAACIFGFVLVAPADTQTLSPMPTADAQVLGNGYDVNCTKVNDLQVLCTVAGCPRVNVEDDLAGDQIHTHINGDAENGVEAGKGCSDTYSRTINTDANKPFTLSVQGCRHHNWPSLNDCGSYADYQYTPPVVAPVNCPAGSKSETVVPPAQCEAAPKVKCPEGSPTTDAVSLDQCAPAPPKACPPGSAAESVPFGQQCQGPTNAVVMNITQEGLNANVAITNNSALPAECAYTATKTGGLLGPGSVSRNISVGPNSTGNITDMLWPPLGTSYRATAKCTAQYDGKSTSIGESTQNVG